MSDDQLPAAIRRQLQRAEASVVVDRRNWTARQYVDDARRLMNELDGAVTSLVNGHVTAMLATIDALEDVVKEGVFKSIGVDSREFDADDITWPEIRSVDATDLLVDGNTERRE